MAAAIAGKVLNIRKDVIRESLADFQGVEHRLEPVITVSGIHFVNDSKGTNVNSTWYALECMETDVIWIAGGVDKGNNYSELFPVVRQKVKAIVCLGKDNKKIIKSFRDLVPTIVETTSMEEAVRSAYYLAKKGQTVLLSPACASFDLFLNYEDRGRKFKQAVRNL
jgi:UDP-N-acetylmuramoylalanine--D-glutamate ligase